MAKNSGKKQTSKSSGSQKRPVSTAASLTRTFEVTDRFPTTPPAVQIIFRGLQCFCFDGKASCEIGIHNKTADPKIPNDPQKHTFRIQKWERVKTPTGYTCPVAPALIIDPEDPPTKDVTITVTDADEFDGVYVYQHPPLDSFDRNNAADGFRRDFRWVLDLEGEDFYVDDAPLGKDPASLKPSVKVHNGLFHTFYRTESKFKRVQPRGNEHDLGFMAGIIAANIYLKNGGKVQIAVGTDVIDTITQKDNHLFQLDVLNDCEDADVCDYNAHEVALEKKRNDFFHYFTTFSVPPLKKKYGLVCSVFNEGNIETGLCTVAGDVSDPSPCVGTGFGRTKNL